METLERSQECQFVGKNSSDTTQTEINLGHLLGVGVTLDEVISHQVTRWRSALLADRPTYIKALPVLATASKEENHERVALLELLLVAN